MEQEHFATPYELGVFRACNAYVDMYAAVGVSESELPFCELSLVAAQVTKPH